MKEIKRDDILNMPTYILDKQCYLSTPNGAYVFTGEEFKQISEVRGNDSTYWEGNNPQRGPRADAPQAAIDGFKKSCGNAHFYLGMTPKGEFWFASPKGNDANKVKPLKVDRSREYPMMTNFDSNDKIHPDCIELTDETPIGNGMTIKDVARHKDVVKLEERIRELENEIWMMKTSVECDEVIGNAVSDMFSIDKGDK